MWSTTLKKISFHGTVKVMIGGTAKFLPGVLVDVYRCWTGADGKFQFQQLDAAPAQADASGQFAFTNLSVPVLSQMATPSTPPYTPVEVVKPASLPTLVFRITLANDINGATSFLDVYDERDEIDAAWLLLHPERVHVALSVTTLDVVIPEGDAEATAIAGVGMTAPSVPAKQFHFLRIGRVTRDEIGAVGSTRPGYMNSASPSFFPGIEDAPFGGQLHLGGYWGSGFPAGADKLYYTVSWWKYAGSLTPPAGASFVEDALFNKKYVIDATDPTKNKWETLHLGPFTGTLAGSATSIKVYKRPPAVASNEYWPFWDLISIWSSSVAPDDLIILTLQAYERVGGTADAPQLKAITMSTGPNSHLPLRIDNRPPALTLTEWETGLATFSPEDVKDAVPLDPCSYMHVELSHPTPSNECIRLKYSIEDGAGNAHPHVLSYSLGVAYTPKQVAGAPLESGLSLKTFLEGGLYKSYSGSYVKATGPKFEVKDFKSVVVPNPPSLWPPQESDSCGQYAVAVRMGCDLRTIDGWAHCFSRTSLGRHIIVSR